MPSSRRLQQSAIAISVASIAWNGVEGGLSIGFGAETSSRSLIFFGIQSAIEVISAVIVVWRFTHIARPGEEHDACLSPRELKFEKYSTIAIGGLLVALALATLASASVGLALHLQPDASTPALIISASALIIMLLIWIPKRYLAKALNSSTMQGEAACSLACIQITLVLFVGALAFKLHHAAWWLDGATSIVLGLMFAAEGGKMLRWACNPAFDGGCCGHDGRGKAHVKSDAEMLPQYRDLCACCDEKDVCKNADSCRCSVDMQGRGAGTQACCELRDDGKCCTRELRTGVRPTTTRARPQGVCAEGSCSAPTAPPPITCTKGCCASTASEATTCKKGCCDLPSVPPPTCTRDCGAPATSPVMECCDPTPNISCATSKSEGCSNECCADISSAMKKQDMCEKGCCS